MMEDPCEKVSQQLGEAESVSQQAGKNQRPQIYNYKDLDFANNLKELGN